MGRRGSGWTAWMHFSEWRVVLYRVPPPSENTVWHWDTEPHSDSWSRKGGPRGLHTSGQSCWRRWERSSLCGNQLVTTENALRALRPTGCLASGPRRDQDGPQGSQGDSVQAIRSLEPVCGGGHCPGACQRPVPQPGPSSWGQLVSGWHPPSRTWESSSCFRAPARILHLGLPQRHEHPSVLFGGTCG